MNRFEWICKGLNPDQQYTLEERAAIYEFDAGLTRADAERQAIEDWLDGKMEGNDVND